MSVNSAHPFVDQYSVSGPQIVRTNARENTRKRGRGGKKEKGSLLPFYFHVRAFRIPADPTISDPGTG